MFPYIFFQICCSHCLYFIILLFIASKSNILLTLLYSSATFHSSCLMLSLHVKNTMSLKLSDPLERWLKWHAFNSFKAGTRCFLYPMCQIIVAPLRVTLCKDRCCSRSSGFPPQSFRVIDSNMLCLSSSSSIFPPLFPSNLDIQLVTQSYCALKNTSSL